MAPDNWPPLAAPDVIGLDSLYIDPKLPIFISRTRILSMPDVCSIPYVAAYQVVLLLIVSSSAFGIIQILPIPLSELKRLESRYSEKLGALRCRWSFSRE